LGVKDIAVDAAMELFLARQNLKASSVLKTGETIYLSEKIGGNYGGSCSEDFEICHPDNKELFLRAAEVLGDPIVGFDFIIPDVAVSWRRQQCGFIEANSLPFINLHHDALLGKPRNAAAMVWDMMGM
jgi:D-alanine-D-alanine ligase-like ATP-grasp enzyme